MPKLRIPPIRKIDIEIHSYCNRKCNWCSNAIYPRDFYKEMPDSMFSKIIDELRSWRFNRPISLMRYNESFYNHKLLVKRIHEIREKLPKAKICCNTNGDFLNNDIDLDYLTIMDYDNKLTEFCNEEKGIRVMRLKNIGDRAGILKNLSGKREFPCFEPTYVAVVDYLGNIGFCCHLRYECDVHKPYFFGNINDTTIKKAYYSQKATKFRDDVANMIFPGICKTCTTTPGRFSRKEYTFCSDYEDYNYEE